MARSATLDRRRSGRSGRNNGVIRTYRNAVAFLDSLTNYENLPLGRRAPQSFKLARMIRLMAELKNPHRAFRSAHVAGTKGKGSTATMIASMLQANGLEVGLYTSPHLLDVRERITINGRMISEPEFARLTARVAQAARRLRNDPPTFFEALTAVAFLYFARREVDLAVLEVGLGGRLDATNVVRPEVCAVTSISLDHMQQLGATLAEIAEEKAGIFKEGVPVVSAPQATEIKKVLRRVAQKVRCPLLFSGEEIEFSSRFESSRTTGPHTQICVTTPTSHFEHLPVPLMGEHQATNCAVALGVIDQLKTRGYRIDDEAVVAGLAAVRIPGRMEIIRENPRVLVDCAHNAASVEAVMRAIGQNIALDSMVVIFGCNADKDVDGMLRVLSMAADKIIFTRSTHPRAADPGELAARYREFSGRLEQTAPALSAAMEIASKAVGREDLICITGSFYLVADAKRLLARKPRPLPREVA